MDDKQYSIIREQGEFMEPVALNDHDNKIVNNNDKDDYSDDESN